MKTSNLKTKLSLLAGAALLALPMAAVAQETLPADSTAIGAQPEMAISTPTVTETPKTTAVPSTLSVVGSEASTDPAVTAVMDRLKQDSTPLSISDMSAAQDALARLNLLSEIEQKLTQIEETRQKRQLGAFTPMGAMPLPGNAMIDPASMPPGMNPAAFAGFDNAEDDKPQVVSITGAAGTYRAVINDNGRNSTVKSGSVLSDGSKVSSINASGVTVNKKGKKTTLPFLSAE